MNNVFLQSTTLPSTQIGLSHAGLTQYRKELIKVGNYVKASTNQTIKVTKDMLNHWVATFSQWIGNGNKVPIPAMHEREGDPLTNQGWVTSLFIEDNSLFGVLELLDAKLALVSDVSIAVPNEITDGKGNKYKQPITHVALTTTPVVSGLEDFVKLSLSTGENNMEFIKKIAAKLKIAKENPTEEDVLLALNSDVTAPPQVTTLENQTTAPATQVVKLVSENRDIKLSGLVKAGIITPAVKDVIAARYVENKAVTMELSLGTDSGFDFLYDVLSKNNPVKLAEVTGVQSLELSNPSVKPASATKKVVNKKREAAGLKPV